MRVDEYSGELTPDSDNIRKNKSFLTSEKMLRHKEEIKDETDQRENDGQQTEKNN